MALQSAGLLARHLIAHREDVAAGRRHDTVASGYDADWRAGFASRICAAAAFAHLAMRPQAVSTLLPILKLFPRILTLGARLSGKSTEVVAAR